MNQQEKAAIVHGLALFGEYGREAADAVKAALGAGELGVIEFQEAQAWLEDIDAPAIVAEAFEKAQG